jgi:hypothetical protein
MLKPILVAAALSVIIGSAPAFAKDFKRSCEEVCADRCAQKELAPGLYRSECQTHCAAACYRNRSEKSGGD